jgi:hypothetical protein
MRARTLHPLSRALNTMTGKSIPAEARRFVSLFWHWDEVAGETLARQVSPVRWARSAREQKTLWLQVLQGMAMDLWYQKPVLQERIEHYVGHPVRLVLEEKMTNAPADLPRKKPSSLASSPALWTPNPRTLPLIQTLDYTPLRQAFERWHTLMCTNEQASNSVHQNATPPG